MSLIFLVQGVAITSKLSSMPSTYSEGFAGGFAMFNLQGMQPPKWARAAMNWEKGSAVPNWLFDDSDVGRNLKNHFFYLVSAFGITVLAHLLGLGVCECRGMADKVPGFLKFPQVEIKAFMVLNMGLVSGFLASADRCFPAYI